jgi:protein-S-isoprenylcysteine O-methyltransferase Ste14
MTENRMQSKPDHPGIIAPPPLIYIGVLGFALLLDWIVVGPSLGLPYLLRMILATLLLVVGASIDIAGGSRFIAAKTNIHPWKPSKSVVTTGIFRYTRNPMYLGMALIYASLCLFANSAIALAGLLPALALIEYGVIRREERYLEAKFEEQYRAYTRQVRRWI